MKPLLFSDSLGSFIKLRQLPKYAGIELMGWWLDNGQQVFMQLEVWMDTDTWEKLQAELVSVGEHEGTYEHDFTVRLGGVSYDITYQMHHERDCEVFAALVVR